MLGQKVKIVTGLGYFYNYQYRFMYLMVCISFCKCPDGEENKFAVALNLDL